LELCLAGLTSFREVLIWVKVNFNFIHPLVRTGVFRSSRTSNYWRVFVASRGGNDPCVAVVRDDVRQQNYKIRCTILVFDCEPVLIIAILKVSLFLFNSNRTLKLSGDLTSQKFGVMSANNSLNPQKNVAFIAGVDQPKTS